MPQDTVIPELIFSKPKLDNLNDASEHLAALLNLIRLNKVVKINLKNVILITPDFADHVFGIAAAECIIHDAKMNLFFRSKSESKLISQVIIESISKSLPITLGGSATLH